MLLAFVAAAIAVVAVAADVLAPRVKSRWHGRRQRSRRLPAPTVQDPGRELRAEQKARALLRSCVNDEEWDMYRDLGFLRVLSTSGQERDEPCSYLLYPHLPIVAYVPSTRRLLGEYCVSFDDPSRPYGSGRLPDSDDVLAKWMALTGDEHRLIATANMHLPGRQVSPAQVQRDLVRLAKWDQDRAREQARVGADIGRAGCEIAPAGAHSAPAAGADLAPAGADLAPAGGDSSVPGSDRAVPAPTAS